ncbi:MULTISPECIES: hypothetical protein [unclassified Castellaniella]|uniref:hypothetical protein n=1 Tax=unclassified Castellaniella TaxID=2617606 RepID=UPI003315EC32
MNITHSLTRTSLALATALGFALAGGPVMAASASTQAASSHAMNWFGGPVYTGDPALQATAALVAAGGGASHFTFDKALVSMLGEKTVNAEVAKLTKQYGEKEVKTFIDGMTYAVNDGLKRATEAGVKLPAAPADLKGPALAKGLVQAGTVDGTFWSGYLFDKALSHDLHNKVMVDIDTKFGHDTDKVTHKVLNQAMYDVAQALGDKQVKLASLH